MLPALTLPELTALLASPVRASAAVRWLWAPGEAPSALPDVVPGVAREVWPAVRALGFPSWRVRSRRASTDGTVKLAVDFAGAVVETVVIPARGRTTVCVSSQAGCTRDCRFCATAALPFARNLTAAELVLQVLIARGFAPAEAPLRNVVFMGMGEPMDNLDEVLRAIACLTQAPAPRLAASRVTVSSSGILPGMKRFLAESRASLALSLNATTDEARARLMPQTKRWPIASLLGLLRDDARATGRRHLVTYVLFDGVNDTAEDAARLAGMVAGCGAHVNVIPWNQTTDDRPQPTDAGMELRPPARERVQEFARLVQAAGVRAIVRWPRGQEIDAACGQLALRAESA